MTTQCIVLQRWDKESGAGGFIYCLYTFSLVPPCMDAYFTEK